ncbi:hypothetical protein NDU88_004610 [Pleurodeles waltl]|uniref:Uncharacterized protein n=1 Tax=Pleurodeles waltl TaxID=8319 RepID=A0AAV7TSX9_PLEWA|nr:hypothetical protein NDU88_004610 [Pleurodeles waltl]
MWIRACRREGQNQTGERSAEEAAAVAVKGGVLYSIDSVPRAVRCGFVRVGARDRIKRENGARRRQRRLRCLSHGFYRN